MDNEIKCCSNCKFFVAYYVKHNRKFCKTIQGYCLNEDIYPNMTKKKFKFKYDCNGWQPESIAVEKRQESIKRVICGMKNTLDEIAEILKDDNNS